MVLIMEKDHLKALVKDVDSQLFEVVNNLICSICQELFNIPVTTPCGHTFCNKCIRRVFSSKNNNGCPLCKNPFKEYKLKKSKVKSSLVDICQELPIAFEKDVEDLTKNFVDLDEDLIKSSKLLHIQSQDSCKKLSSKKSKALSTRKIKKLNESIDTENDAETFVPVLKRTKKVLEYASAKKKKLDDLVSISQTEPASNSSLGYSSELDKKLKKIEKIPPEKKVNEWFNAVGDNIFINSPGSSILETSSKNGIQSEKKEQKSSMIRRDYNKAVISSNTVKDTTTNSVDPYEFIPSQNNKIIKKRRQKRSSVKKIPDFKALQNFSKESLKRSTILLNEEEEADGEAELKDVNLEKRTTASQKFEQLLSESKQEEKKSHALFSSSQSSSTKFLDVSFHSKVEEILQKKEKTPKVPKKLTEEEDILFKNVESVKEDRKGLKSKRSRSRDLVKSGKKKKLFSEIIGIGDDEAVQLEKSLEKYLIKGKKKVEPSSTKLGELLTELLDDDIIYATRPINAPIRLPDLVVGLEKSDNSKSLKASDGATQNTELIGFCTQEETPDERNFKLMVENMEKELDLSERLNEDSVIKIDKCMAVEPCSTDETFKIDLDKSQIENSDCISVDQKLEIPETQVVKFLHLGKLTPIRKRTKSTVVKLVFPIGLTSLARRYALESRSAPIAQVIKQQVCQVSTGIQTSQRTVSSLVQTSQVPQSSIIMQTSQEVKPSVEIQTSQRLTTSANVQTSQTLICQEIQTTQAECQSAQVQTSQQQGQAFSSSNPKLPETQIRKPTHQHRKIIERKVSRETMPDSTLRLQTFEEEKYPVENELIMDFGVDKEIYESWRNNQEHEQLVELKNKKNKEQNEKLANIRRRSIDADSDDSDVQPPKRRSSLKIFSQDSVGVLENYEGPQLIPLDVRKLSQNSEMEVIDLDTPKSENSELQMLRLLKNIDMDLPKERSGNLVRGEKSEESDSDFFVEQTPPRPTPLAINEIKNQSKFRCSLSVPKQVEIKETGIEKKENSEDIDLIGDSIPKGFSESFTLPSVHPRIPLTPEKTSKDDTQKKLLPIEPPAPIDLPNENDQNQLNAFENKTPTRELSKVKATQLKSAVGGWKQTESSQKKLCVVASSVKNPETIKKFVSKFQIEYLNKPTKDMTHLIVGLHENDEKEMLPLCTPKLLFAMANKKWVVSELWVETCLKMNLILPEETFETLDPVGGCGCRKARLSSDDLLKNCEVYLLGEFQMISKEDFANLIADSGGTLVHSPEKFSFLHSKLRMIIADPDCLKLSEKQMEDLYQKHSTAIFSRDVIIMSIQSYRLVNLFPYILHSTSEENLVKLGYPYHLVKNEEDEEAEEGEESNASLAR